MKSKWLKKAMAAFLAVLMTVCALPVAAFVPEMVETGEEFDGAENALPYYYVSDGNLYVQIENETQQIYPEYSFEYIYSGYEYVFAHGKNENGEIYDIVLGFMDCVDFDSKAENANLYTVTGSANETAIYNYAVNTMGLNTAAACGILANIQKESGFNPHALGDSGTSYGICQWHNSRWDRLKAYCTSNNLDSTTIEGQLRYLEYELKNFYSSVWNRLKSVENTAEGAYDAAAYWCAVFEVPAGYGYWSNGEIHYGETSIARGNLAKSTYWNEYSSAGDSSTNASLTATNAQQQVVDYALSKVGTSFANGYCQAFVSYTYANAGVGCGQVFYCCATKAWQTCGKGYSISDIPLGATVYFSDENAGSSRVYDDVCKQYCGHVGIYVGNGYVVHGWGGKVVKTTLNYITQCGYPYRGWGWHANFALADIKDVNFDTITTNTYRLVNNGSYLTTTADNNTTVLTAKAKSGTSNQQFYISPNSRFSQSYIIKSQAYSSGRVVNVFTTGVSANGDNVTLYTSTTDASQSWRFEAKSGGYLIHPVDNTGLALTNSNGTVKVMTSSGASNQIWTLASAVDTYTVSYNANGGTGAPGNQTKTHGQSLTLSNVKPTKDGYTFQGWSTSSTGSVQYNPGSAYTGNANLTLYAVWNPVKYPIYFNANGGTGAPGTQYQTHFEYLTLSSVVPKKDGYTFKGWSTTLNGSVAYQPGGQFGENRSVTLYAVWAVIPVTSVTLNKTSASLKKGETLTLTATVAPSDAANKSVTWSSSNTSVATVSTSGVVTAVGEGTAVITVKTADGGKTATCTVAVAHTHSYTGTYYETAHPHKAYSKCSCGEINYTGATQKVASCASCYPVTGVTLDKTTASLKKGETLALAVTVSPSDAANKAFTVTSSNPSVMSAKYGIGICVGDLFGDCTASHCEFTALSAGSTTLTFTTEDGQKTASCKVTVTEPVVNAKAKFTLSETSGRPGDTVKITLSLKTEETVNSIAISGITYDKSIMTFTGFSDYEHIEDLTILPPTFDEEKMAIVIGLKNAAAFDGDICTLNFKINENALEGVTNIDASSVVKLKSAEIPSAVASGKVNIRLQTLGDIDGNDTVDIDDAVLLFQYSMLPELYPISYAGNLDFNKDGTVDIDDAVRLFQYSMLPDLYPLE